jgi:hypothetical protein
MIKSTLLRPLLQSLMFSYCATLAFETGYALQHLKQLRECSSLISNPPAPLSPYESKIIKDEDSVSWKLWLASFGVYVGCHQSLIRTRTFRNRPFVPQFIAVAPAMALIVSAGALFRQRTLEKLANPPPAAQAESVLMHTIREKYSFPE